MLRVIVNRRRSEYDTPSVNLILVVTNLVFQIEEICEGHVVVEFFFHSEDKVCLNT